MDSSQDLDHILHEHQAALTVERENRFGMELHRFHGKVAMANAHDDAVIALRRDLETRRQAPFDRVKRMIAADAEGFR